jgi:DNA recombination protein RmuC
MLPGAPVTAATWPPGVTTALWIAVLLLAALVVGVLLRLPRRDDRGLAATLRDAGREQALLVERGLRDQVEAGARANRQELAAQIATAQQALLTQSGDIARTQNEQIDGLRLQLAAMQQQIAQTLATHTDAGVAAQQRAAEALTAAQQRAAQGLVTAMQQQGEALAAQFARFAQTQSEQLRALAEGQERRLAEVRSGVETRLAALQEGNERKLEQMRATVDEKLQATLEQRLGESFRVVAERLEQVHRGLGEMQGLARDVGSLNRVLSNVKTRGTFGEVQLAALLDQVFTPDQVGRNVEVVPGTGARVEFALKLPGRAGAAAAAGDAPPVWLPIDAKFPREDHERLLDAQERADAPAAEAAARAIEARLRLEARSIREKYLAPPHTTEFAILFVPTEGLYAEALRRPGLVEALQREHRVTLAGPTTLLAMLSSLQMGFRTLALEQRSAEVWQVLGAVKTEFAKFGDVLARTKRKLEEASSSIDAAQVRTRQMARRLKGVEELPTEQARDLLPGLEATPPADDDGIDAADPEPDSRAHASGPARGGSDG